MRASDSSGSLLEPGAEPFVSKMKMTEAIVKKVNPTGISHCFHCPRMEFMLIDAGARPALVRECSCLELGDQRNRGGFRSLLVGQGFGLQPFNPLDCCIMTGARLPLPPQDRCFQPSQWPVS